MKPTAQYGMFVILMLSIGGILFNSITSNAHGLDKPALIPKSGNDSPQSNEIPQNKDSNTALMQPRGSGGSGAGTLGCMEGTGGNTGKECIPCDPGLGFPGCIPPEGTFGGVNKAAVKSGGFFPFCLEGTGGSTGKACVPCNPIATDYAGAKKCEIFGGFGGTTTGPNEKEIKITVTTDGGSKALTVSPEKIQNLQKSKTLVQTMQKVKDSKDLLSSVKELENIKYLPQGTSEKLNSLFNPAKQLEGTFTGGNSGGTAEIVACGWICKSIVTAVVKAAIDYVKKEYERWPCPGSTWPTEGDGNPVTIECGPEPGGK